MLLSGPRAKVEPALTQSVEIHCSYPLALGEIVAVPVLANKANSLYWVARKAIFDDLGFKESEVKTLDDIHNVLLRCKEQYPNMLPLSGDNLSKIAKKFYGDANKYPVIFEANKPMLKDPNKIYPGQNLRIPPL